MSYVRLSLREGSGIAREKGLVQQATLPHGSHIFHYRPIARSDIGTKVRMQGVQRLNVRNICNFAARECPSKRAAPRTRGVNSRRTVYATHCIKSPVPLPTSSLPSPYQSTVRV